MKTVFLSGWATPPSLFSDVLPDDTLFLDSTLLIDQYKTVEKLTNHLVETLLSETDIHLIGWSTGAIIALELLKKTHVNRATLFAPTLSFLKTDSLPGVDSSALASLQKGVHQKREITMKHFFRNCGFRERKDLSAPYSAEQLSAGLTFLEETVITHPLSAPANTALIHGLNDRIIPVASGRAVSEALNKPLTEISGGHTALLSYLPTMVL